MIKSKFLAVGVMSGTSMDGIDISLILSDGKKSYNCLLYTSPSPRD